MGRQWSPALTAVLVFGVVGCTHTTRQPDAVAFDAQVHPAAYHPPNGLPPDQAWRSSRTQSPRHLSSRCLSPWTHSSAGRLAENRTVQAAFHNVRL